MDSTILDALFRDPVLSRLTTGKSSGTRLSLPETLVARVVSLKGDLAVLRWTGGNFTATLSAEVTPGETLLLKHDSINEGRLHYRIMSRMNITAEVTQGPLRENSDPFLFALMPRTAELDTPVPSLVRFRPGQTENSKELHNKTPLLEIYVETDHFGLLLIEIYYHRDERLECHFVVESREAGEALQEEASKIIAETELQEEDNNGRPLSWSVGNLRQTVVEVLNRGGFNFNAKA